MDIGEGLVSPSPDVRVATLQYLTEQYYYELELFGILLFMDFIPLSARANFVYRVEDTEHSDTTSRYALRYDNPNPPSERAATHAGDMSTSGVSTSRESFHRSAMQDAHLFNLNPIIAQANLHTIGVKKPGFALLEPFVQGEDHLSLSVKEPGNKDYYVASMSQMYNALAYIELKDRYYRDPHPRHIIRRDPIPGAPNVSADLQYVLIDLGNVCLDSEEYRHIHGSRIVTHPYSLLGNKGFDVSSELFGKGVNHFLALTGLIPFLPDPRTGHYLDGTRIGSLVNQFPSAYTRRLNTAFAQGNYDPAYVEGHQCGAIDFAQDGDLDAQRMHDWIAPTLRRLAPPWAEIFIPHVVTLLSPLEEHQFRSVRDGCLDFEERNEYFLRNV